MKLGYSIENVAKDIGISKGNMSEIENGKRLMRFELFKQFLSVYKIPFNLNPEPYEVVRNLLDKLMQAFLYRDLPQEKRIELKIRERESQFEASFACLHLLMLKVFFVYLPDWKPEGEEAIHYIHQVFDFYQSDEKALILFCEGLLTARKKKYKEAVTIYRRALQEMDRILWPQLEGIIQLNLGICTSRAISFAQGAEMNRLAKENFLKYGNYYRMIMAYNNELLYLAWMQGYDTALEHFDEIIQSKAIFKNQIAFEKAVKNKIVVLILSEDFNKAVELMESYPEAAQSAVSDFILYPYCWIRLDRRVQAVDSLVCLEKCRLDPDERLFLELLKADLLENRDLFEKAKYKMVKYCSSTSNWGFLMIVFQYLIYYYTKLDDKDFLIEAYKQYNLVLRHQFPEVSPFPKRMESKEPGNHVVPAGE